MECKYAKRRQGARALDCQILKEKGDRWYSCGNQRYCPVKQSVILTAGAFRCPVREKHEEELKAAQQQTAAQTEAKPAAKKNSVKKTTKKQRDKEET